jgi:excinuclease ABC subunit C
MDTVRRNAELAFQSRFRAGHTQGVEALAALRDALGLEDAPYRIEAFDISHLQGTAVVASMVAWEGGRPHRAGYRHFNVRSVDGQDDFASMAEVVGRRYRRLVREERRMPDLILIDGGPGQLAAARRALVESGAPPVAMAALAKREEEVFLPGRREPLRLERTSAALRLLQQIRDEAHRFALTYHRKVRSRSQLQSELQSIAGVGPARAGRLLKGLGSLKKVRSAGEDDLARYVPRSVARAIRAHFDSAGPSPRHAGGPKSR